MAIFVLTDASVTYNSVDLSDHVESVEINMNYDDVEITAMGDTAHSFIPGLRQDTITLNFFQDFASGKTDATIQGLLGSSAGAALVVKPTSSAVSTTNPSYTMTAAPFTYQPIAGSVSEASMTSVEFRPVAGGSIVRATA